MSATQVNTPVIQHKLKLDHYYIWNDTEEKYVEGIVGENAPLLGKDVNVRFTITAGEKNLALLSYSFENISEYQMTKFIVGLRSKTIGELQFDSGSNQEATIRTENGITTFSYWGMGGADPVFFSITLQNEACVEAFQQFIHRDG
jgi:hypothetical protein